MMNLFRPSHWGLRARSAAAAAAVVGIVLLLGAGAMMRMLDLSLVSGVDSSTAAQASAVAGQLSHDSLSEWDGSALATDSRVTVIQILDSSGRVLHTSNRIWSAPLIDHAVTAGRSDANGVQATTGPDADLRVSARQSIGPSGELTVLAAASKQPVEDTIAKVAGLLAWLGPIVVLVAAASTYGLVGRSLGSVEAIRSRVAGIEAGDLSQRVPVPTADDEIARLAATMNEMLARVEAGNAAQRRFVGDASHELRSPLATIITALELGTTHAEFLDRDVIATTLLPEARRMQQLVDDLLILATADEHGLPLSRADVDLDDLAAMVASTVRSATVTTDLHPARVVGDAAKLTRVIRNLVDNAATHATSTIAITTTTTDTGARLTVDDDGPGIPPADRQRVFERFTRLASDRGRASGGAGLGLAIVAEIVAAHHGTVTITDAPTGGARVTVDLP